MKKIATCFPTTQNPISKLRITTNIPNFCDNSQRDHLQKFGDIRENWRSPPLTGDCEK